MQLLKHVLPKGSVCVAWLLAHLRLSGDQHYSTVLHTFAKQPAVFCFPASLDTVQPLQRCELNPACAAGIAIEPSLVLSPCRPASATG